MELIEGKAEALPVESGWADLVISNGVLNLAFCKRSAFAEVARVLSPAAGSKPPTWCWSRGCPTTSGTTSSRGRTESAERFRVSPTWRACSLQASSMRRSSARAVTGRPTTPRPCISELGSPSEYYGGFPTKVRKLSGALNSPRRSFFETRLGPPDLRRPIRERVARKIVGFFSVVLSEPRHLCRGHDSARGGGYCLHFLHHQGHAHRFPMSALHRHERGCAASDWA